MACFEAMLILPSVEGEYRSMKAFKGTITMSIIAG